MERLDKYEAARKQVAEEKKFYSHLMIYCIVIGSLWLLNAATSPGHWWAFWPTFGWGIGLFFHGFGLFGKNAIFGKKWEERRMKQLLNKEEEK
jgi:hypothetical protein